MEGLSKAVLTGVNAGVNRYLGGSQQQTAAQNNAISTAQGNSTTPTAQATLSPPASYDPAYQKAECLRLAASSLHHIATEGPDSGVDWSIVEGDGQNGLSWVRGTMETALGGNFGTDQPSVTAKQLLSTGVQVRIRI